MKILSLKPSKLEILFKKTEAKERGRMWIRLSKDHLQKFNEVPLDWPNQLSLKWMYL